MDVVEINEELKKRFVEICTMIDRPGMSELMTWLERSDFYTAPASSRFHGNLAGRLLEHSLNVYDKLSEYVSRYPELNIPYESVSVVALLMVNVALGKRDLTIIHALDQGR